jgi:survival of motor neuron-related-splicing factor 30
LVHAVKRGSPETVGVAIFASRMDFKIFRSSGSVFLSESSTMAEDGPQSLDELEEQLKTQQNELQEVEEALAEDPTNEDVLGMKKDILELIDVTQRLIEKTKSAANASKIHQQTMDLDSVYLSPLATVNPASASNGSLGSAAASGASGAFALSSKPVQERAQASGIYVGLKCEAIWSGDENWYSAEVTEINDQGVTVRFTEYGDIETIAPEKIRLEGGRGKKRKEAEPGAVSFEVPKWLQILSTDPESVRKAKKKRIKALKLQNKIQVREEETKQKKASWQEFTQQANKKRKLGALTGMCPVFPLIRF